MKVRRRTVVVALLLACIAAAAVLAGRYLSPSASGTARPLGVMGTETELIAVCVPARPGVIGEALRQAEAALRDVEVRMSAHLSAGELGRLNDAPPGEVVPLSAETMRVLRLAHAFAAQTDGAFDVTCRPLIETWKQAGRAKRLPTDEEIAAALARTGWRNFELLDGGVRKLVDGAGVDLGGIAKGFGIDRAVEAMRQAGATGGLVNVGGDVACFGRRQDGRAWRIAVQSPFDASAIALLELTDGAVCTSGNYQRFVEIDGKRYSHIMDPRTGRPAEMTPSVTVTAPTAVTADAWATALSVLGRAGLDRIPAGSGLEAMLVLGSPGDYRLHATAGLRRLLVEQPPELED